MSEKPFVQDKDLASMDAEIQPMVKKKPKKPADGAVEKAFDRFLSLIERLLK